MEFDKSIFINCPFDDEYKPLLKTLLFVIKKLGFIPRISLERNDSGEVRLNKIKELIESSKFGIHDLSRHKSKKSDEYFRLNMPFELGLDLGLGCRDFNPDSKFRNKKILILEQEKYSTQKALSDLSFADCKCHNGQEEELVYEVRTWIIENGFKVKQSGSSLWDEYNIFNSKLFEQKINEKFTQKDIDLMSVAEFLGYL